MIATFEDAHLLFARWKEDGSVLRVKLVTNSVVFEAKGAVAEYTHVTLQLGSSDWQLTLPTEGAKFTFLGPTRDSNRKHPPSGNRQVRIWARGPNWLLAIVSFSWK